MFLCLEGFSPPDHGDDFVQFELDVSPKSNQAVLDVVGWRSLEEGVRDGVVELTAEQVRKIEAVLGKPIQNELEISIGVYA